VARHLFRNAFFKLGPGDVTVHVTADGRELGKLVRPKPGAYRLAGLGNGRHRLRVEVASESQSGPTAFDGFYAPRPASAGRPPSRPRQIEFIGDSHTVGYGNTSAKRECTEDEVWSTTDTSLAFGPLLAKRYGADYQVNAISGRGVVRNYNGFKAPTLPEAYPFVLFDRPRLYRDAGWRPQLIVVSLGTNDFSTPLSPGEKWRSRRELRADFEERYVDFVRSLRARNPQAFLILWATDTANGEVAEEAGRVVERLKAAGERRIAFVPIAGLQFSGCNYHPSLADERTIADRLAKAVQANPALWRR
jgi:lysophospholipase L1-like esterase